MSTPGRLISPAQLDAAALAPWLRGAIGEFERRVCDADVPFPCHFARIALTRTAIRYASLEDAGDAAALDALAAAMRAYVERAPSIPGHTSLVVFVAHPREHRTDAAYHAWFWGLLQELHCRDPAPWPASVPVQPDDPAWEFCFAGMPMFALGAGPIHRVRASRRADVITLAFQPRFVFDRAFPTRQQYDRACEAIRARVERYDGGQGVHPSLGAYADADAREWRQYVVPDTNDAEWDRCPFEPRETDEGGLVAAER